MDWSKLSDKELKDFIDLNGSGHYAACAKKLFDTGTNLRLTEPVSNLYIASQFTGRIPEKYDPEVIRHLPPQVLKQFAAALNTSPDAEQIIKVLNYLGAIYPVDNFSNVLDENLVNIALKLDYNEILNLCRTSHRFAAMCREVNFWRDKTMVDFNITGQQFNDKFTKLRNLQQTYVAFLRQNFLQDTFPGSGSLIISGANLLFAEEELLDKLSDYGPVTKILKVGDDYYVTYQDKRDADDFQDIAQNDWDGVTVSELTP